jgi:methionyl-tRNA formyltransferase
MRVGFAGTPPFAARALAAILDAGFPVPLALTRPDRARDRGLRVQPSAVSVLAAARGVPLLAPPTLKTPEARAPLLSTPLDVLVVAAYGLILPPEVLAWPAHGCINIHASVLPRWRGAAPIERAILAGDAETGVSLMQMDAGLDTGAVITTERVAMAADDTTGTLTERLAATGAAAIVRALQQLAATGQLAASPQPASGVTYAAKIDKVEAMIDWREAAESIERRVRAFDPFPGATAMLRGTTVKLWQAHPEPQAAGAPPGRVLAIDAQGALVACGTGALKIVELQPAGGRRMPASALAAGRRIAVGDVLTRQPAATNAESTREST